METIIAGIAEASIHVSTRRTNAQLSASGTLGAMNVGLVLCFPNAVSVLSRTQVLWEAWRQQTVAVTAGPISASKFSTVHVAFQVDPLAQPGTVTLYLGANRGRGQTNHVVVSRSMQPRSRICRMLPQSREPSERRRHAVYISVILRNHVRKGEDTKRVGCQLLGTMLCGLFNGSAQLGARIIREA